MVAIHGAQWKRAWRRRCITYSLDRGKHFEKILWQSGLRNPKALPVSAIRASSGTKQKGLLGLVLASGDHAEFMHPGI